MIKYENHCVGCPPEKGCLSYCPYKNVKVIYCDKCGSEGAEYHIYGDGDLCIDCLHDLAEEKWKEKTTEEKAELVKSLIDNDYLNDIFADMSAVEQAELFDISVTKAGD